MATNRIENRPYGAAALLFVVCLFSVAALYPEKTVIAWTERPTPADLNFVRLCAGLVYLVVLAVAAKRRFFAGAIADRDRRVMWNMCMLASCAFLALLLFGEGVRRHFANDLEKILQNVGSTARDSGKGQT